MRINKFTIAVVAGSIAISSAFAAPVAAGDRGDRLAKIAIGVAAIAIAANVIHNKNKSRSAPVTQYDSYKPYQPRVVYREPPKTCLRQRYTRYGWETFYSRRCLNKHRARQQDYYANYNNNGYGNTRYQNRARYNNTVNHQYTSNGNNNYNRQNNESDFYRQWNDRYK